MGTRLERIVEIANQIVTGINHFEIFTRRLNINVTKQGVLSYNITFYVDDSNYASALYFLSESQEYVQGKILSVNSTIPGSRIGSFLLQLHLLLSVISNITQLELDNYTDDPARAASGIYKNFKWKITKKAAAGKSQEEKSQISEGEMIWLPASNNRQDIEGEMASIIDYVKKNESTLGQGQSHWNIVDIVNKIQHFNHYYLKQSYGGRNGKRKTKSIRRKTKSIRRKTKSIRRKTKSIRRNFKYKITAHRL
jgi:hypothetical protein